MGPSSLANPEGELEEVLLRCGVLKSTGVDRLVACISVELLDDLPGLLVPSHKLLGVELASPIRS
jgi:hypothetical protein